MKKSESTNFQLQNQRGLRTDAQRADWGDSAAQQTPGVAESRSEERSPGRERV